MSLSLASRPEDLIAALERLGLARAHFVWDGAARAFRASHPELDGLAREIASDDRDFDEHEAIFLEVGADSKALFGAFLHRTIRGQGAGGVRFWPYESLRGYVEDGLRLSHGMGRKNALAGLWWGGAKGVIAKTRDVSGEGRAILYREYGAFVTSIRGCYVTAEDAGTRAADMAEIFRTTRFTTCIPPELGGSGNPSFATAKGVVCAMEAALDFAGLGTLDGKSVAMQGTGNVGAAMIGDLLDRKVARIVAADISKERSDALAERFSGAPVELRLVSQGDLSIFEEPCDVFAPNALGGCLGPETIPRLRAKVVCGAANNQLLDERRDDRALEARGALYVPDFLANRMGIVSCSNEQYGSLPSDPAIDRHFSRDWDGSIFATTKRVLERARRESTTPARAAAALADELSREAHPIWGHRVRAIIDSLVAEKWNEQPSAKGG